jgi:septal ring factor EnvC (AmiA/AmiB activator)
MPRHRPIPLLLTGTRASPPGCAEKRWASRRLPGLGLLFLLLWPVLVGAATGGDEHTRRLEKLRGEIKTLRSELDADRERKQDLQEQLRNMEKQIGAATALLKALDIQLTGQRRELAALQREQAAQKSDLANQREGMARQIRAAYTIGQQEFFKVLLNQQDPAAVTRTLTYYDYFHRARLKRIEVINDKLTALTLVQQAIEGQTEALEQTRQEQRAEKDQLEQTRGERATVLGKLDERIRDKGERLQLLLEDQKRLETLINRLADEAIEKQTAQADKQAFATLRGRLPWPTQGRLTARYGSARVEGNLQWQGVLIDSEEGVDVRAISHGRVAFSDWLRGFGLLIIIDHGDGYMSLYGGNQSLYKEVGDWVDASEVIAGVGNSGGRQQAALYFEIRQNGKPINPLKWCKNEPKQIARR